MYSVTLISLLIINVVLLFLTRIFDFRIQYFLHFFLALVLSVILPKSLFSLEEPLQILLIITTIMSLRVFNTNIIYCFQELKNKYLISLIIENLAIMISLCILFSLILEIAPTQILLIASLLTIPSTITMNYLKTLNDEKQTTLIIYLFFNYSSVYFFPINYSI